MAQTHNQTEEKEQPEHNNSPNELALENQLQQRKPPTSSNQVKRETSFRQQPTGQRLERSTPLRLSKGLTFHPVKNLSTQGSASSTIVNKIQPSKAFASKCRTELQSLLDSINKDYHNEFKNLYGDDKNADLTIEIGGQFKKIYHKCIIASRAFKLYSALKGFRFSPEQNIIISEYQNKDENPGECSQVSSKSAEERRREGLEKVTCRLPEAIINPELLINLIRRAYLDQDLCDEETELNRQLVSWLKINKPDLFKPCVKHSPNHRESFRTIQPDFEDLAKSNPSIMADQLHTDTSSPAPAGSVDNEGSVNDLDEASQATSLRDESLTGSLLTRTETFDLITRNNPDSPSLGGNKKTCVDSKELASDVSVNDANESESSEVYAPTTRTGLKPKKFTTPVGISARKTKPAESSSGSPKASSVVRLSQQGESNKLVAKSTPAAIGSSVRNSNLTQSTGAASNAPAAAKRSSLTTTNNSKSKTTAAPVGSTKPTIIHRAHPISMERSQSPGTNLAKGASKNFVAANKRLVSSQVVDRKVGSSSNDEQTAPNYDSENYSSDASLVTLEQLTTENITAHMDKFTLVSQSKLAEALSRLFIDGLLTDSVILVKDGKQISAHKCILAARSAYLNDCIDQQCLPSTTQNSFGTGEHTQPLAIDLSEFSHSTVYFSILHVYSGIVRVPEDIEIEELAKLSHLLHISTLRKVCVNELHMNHCHYFHKPCHVCSYGVLKALPLAWRYDYTELYSKCLQWIGSHFSNIFCLEEFSKLKPHDLIEECYKATLSQLTPDNVIQKTVECQKLLKNLPRVKWTESIICLVGRQLEDFCNYVANNYEKILLSDSFLNLGKSCWECEILEENLLAAMNHLKPDSGCKTLIQLDKIECSIEMRNDEAQNVSESFANLISKMRKYCERYLLKEASSVVHCSSWRQMNPSLQRKIKDQALIASDFDEPAKQLAAKPKLPSSTQRRLKSTPSPQPQSTSQATSTTPRGDGGTHSPSCRAVAAVDSRLKSPSTTFLQPPKNKTPAARHVKVLK